MILSNNEIEEYVEREWLIIQPVVPEQLQAASYDVRLGGSFRVFSHRSYELVRPMHQQPDLTELIHADRYVLHPGDFVLGCTMERFEFPNDLVGRFDGKSSLGRLGLLVHSTAGFFDPGFRGVATVELSNVNRLPIELTAGMLIGQMSFMQLSSHTTRPYDGKYQDASMPDASKSWKDS